MRAHENVVFVSNGTNAGTLELRGGKYLLTWVGTGTGTVDFEIQGPDASTFIKVATQIVATTGQQVLDLPPGLYKVVIATFTAGYFQATRIPGE